MDPREGFALAAVCKKWSKLPPDARGLVKKAAYEPTPSALAFKQAFALVRGAAVYPVGDLGEFMMADNTFCRTAAYQREILPHPGGWTNWGRCTIRKLHIIYRDSGRIRQSSRFASEKYYITLRKKWLKFLQAWRKRPVKRRQSN